MHIINYVSISFRQAKKLHRASGSREGHWGWHPNVLGHAACHTTCVSRAHTPTTSDVSLLVPPLHLINMWNIHIMWNIIILYHVEHYYIVSCGTLLYCIMWNIIIHYPVEHLLHYFDLHPRQ